METVLAAVNNMKKTFSLLILFIILTALIISCPIITQWDRSIIIFVQQKLSFLPLWIPMLPDCILYTAMIILPLVGFGIFFVKKRLWIDLICIYSIPLITFLLNCIIKPIIKRERPPIELQITTIHPDSFSYVSSHSLVTICLWGIVIWYINKFCKYKKLKISLILIGISWIIFVGFSRIWLGVHNPTDVLGAYVLGSFLLCLYITFLKNYRHLIDNFILNKNNN